MLPFILSIIILFLIIMLILCLVYIQKVQKILFEVRPGSRKYGQKSIMPYHEIDETHRDLIRYRDDHLRIGHEERDLELIETKMKFAQLQNQINPHFLYNTLENIRARAILDDNAVIADMTEALSRFFRYNISKRTDVVKLSEELDNIRTYIHIQQYRFSNKFDFQVFLHDEDPEVMNALIPKMTLQPIVENAIFHGMENKIGKGRIELHIESDETSVFVTVEDDGIGMAPDVLEKLREKLAQRPDSNWDTGRSGDGIAMRNVNNRLKLFFGEQCGINVSSTQGVGTEVELALPRRDVQGADTP